MKHHMRHKNGEIIGSDGLATVGEACSIKITVDKTGKTGANDLIFAEIDLVDENGSTAWTANDEVTITVDGGKILGTGSGMVDDEHDYTKNVCHAHHGKLLAAILSESTEVTLTAKAAEFEAKAVIK